MEEMYLDRACVEEFIQETIGLRGTEGLCIFDRPYILRG